MKGSLQCFVFSVLWLATISLTSTTLQAQCLSGNCQNGIGPFALPMEMNTPGNGQVENRTATALIDSTPKNGTRATSTKANSKVKVPCITPTTATTKVAGLPTKNMGTAFG